MQEAFSWVCVSGVERVVVWELHSGREHLVWVPRGVFWPFGRGGFRGAVQSNFFD
jgi:hypothetical protein